MVDEVVSPAHKADRKVSTTVVKIATKMPAKG